MRRAFLYGFGKDSGRDFSHRKAWIVDRLRHLAAVLSIEVWAYAVMHNHYHTILCTRPDLVLLWSDYEVARRWLTLFPLRRKPRGPALPPLEEQISALPSCPERNAVLRRRLSSPHWYMGRLNEHIARRANKEDGVKGRFWESRSKCQGLLDEAAIAAAMVYVDVNLPDLTPEHNRTAPGREGKCAYAWVPALGERKGHGLQDFIHSRTRSREGLLQAAGCMARRRHPHQPAAAETLNLKKEG